MKYLRKDTSLTEYYSSKEYLREPEKKVYFLNYRGKDIHISNIYFDKTQFTAHVVPLEGAVQPIHPRNPDKKRVSEGKKTPVAKHQVFIHINPEVYLNLQSSVINFNPDSIEHVTMVEKKFDGLTLVAPIMITALVVFFSWLDRNIP